MTFSYDRVWADVVAMVRANSSLLATLGGAFLFLPSFAMWLFAPMPAPPTGGDGTDGLRFLTDYYQSNWPSLLLVSIISNFGQAAILLLLLDRERPTVSDALGKAARILPLFFAVSIMTSIAIGIGFFLFVVPGVYLLGRLIVACPVLAAEGMSSPIAAVRRAWVCTKGVGWRVAGLVLLVSLVGWVSLSAASSVLGVIAGLLLSDEGSVVVTAFADALSGALLSLLVALLSAATYRQVQGTDARFKGIFS